MRRVNRILVQAVLIILGSVFLVGPLMVQAHLPSQGPPLPLQDPPEPQPDPPWLSSIYYGATPPQNPDGPVLVFVHGYRGEADDWWTAPPFGDTNDMYLMAYQAGYRTAFVNLGGSDGQETGSMWDNGFRLSIQLATIARHYGVDSLDIVAHSKGGIDAEAAVAHFGGAQLVDHVFTFGSPHQGSELADLVYSDSAGWLARLLGLQDEATRTLQTGYMQFFRSITDANTATQNVEYHRAAGTGSGPTFSGLWLGGLYLSRFGPNDGAVTVASTELPGARTLFIQPYHHYNMIQGHNALPWIRGALGDDVSWPGEHRLYLPILTSNNSRPPGPGSRPGVILRGGRLKAGEAVTQTVPIESGALKVTFDLIVPDETVTATLTAPDALPRPLELIPPTDEDWIFGQAWHLVYTEEDPPSGNWEFTISSADQAAYLLVAIVESPLEVALRGWPDGTMRPGALLSLQAQARHPLEQLIVERIEGRVTHALPIGSRGAGEQGRWGDGEMGSTGAGELGSGGAGEHGSTGDEENSPPHPRTSAPSLPRTLALPDKEGVYVISATVTGEMADGTPFERSFVRSVAVVKPETLRGGPTLLDE